MTTTPATPPTDEPANGRLRRTVAHVGDTFVELMTYVGGVANLQVDAIRWLWRCTGGRRYRLGWPAIYAQVVRLGVKSVGVIALVCGCIGLILALQMAPPLADYGQVDKVPNITVVTVLRELGPLITAIVLTGFAGASIAAELGTMVVGEEIEALEAHALNPVRFLVTPRFIATTVSILVLCAIGELVALASAWAISVTVLEIRSTLFIDNMLFQAKLSDFITGLIKAGVFGAIISMIACYNGLNVTGGAAGVGKATTNTVVHSIIAIIFTDFLFTFAFYALGWA